MKTFILASASPARRRLLTHAGIDPQVVVSGVDESAVEAGDAATLAGTLAALKARAVLDAVLAPDALVLGCDSLLAFDGEILGKPATVSDATARWKMMRGRSGVLYTGHCLIDTATGRSAEAVVATTVHFAEPDDDEIAAYVSTGEPLEVAGAFTIDGLGGAFVAGIEGDHTNVVGLSVPTLRLLLAELGVPITSLWSRGRMDP
ncbi:Maf family protein [Dactylosporangium darangshiense]|uniref:Nucleoside triphosphate pyrophosphatase n=1 Tax=Dactylosporangium darangshiense TaxID=579108 RepID=A0ABP8D5P8_9ACTN